MTVLTKVSALILLVLSALPMLVIYGIMSVADGPYPIFRQWRVGKDNVPFIIYKFRTMVDGEITRAGGLLRKTHLDELPQLWNVLKGDMNFIGPRPETVEYVYAFESESPEYIRRHAVKPGVTGLAQVQLGHTAHWKQKLLWDLDYVDNVSKKMNAAILRDTLYDCITLGGR